MAFDFSSLTSLFRSDSQTVRARSGVVGIDIGTSSVKIVQLKDARGVPTLETYGELQLGPYEGVDVGRSTHLAPNKTIEALVDILREASATAKEVTFSISYNASFTTTIPVPTSDQTKINSMVPIEARKYIPVSLTKVKLEWFPLSINTDTHTTKTLISAIYLESKERYETIMRGCNLRVLASEIEIFSTIRSVLSPKAADVVVLDCGASSTRMYIIHNGVIVKTHSVLLSGTELSDAIRVSLGIEFKDAEELKRACGVYGNEDDTRIQKTVVTELDRGLRELHTVITRYEESEGITIESVVLSGGGALLRGMSEYIENMFSKPVALAHPFSKVISPAFLEDTLKEAGPSFAVAVGVALRAFEREE